MSTLAFYAQFTKTLVGVNSLTVTWDVEQITRSDGTRAALVTGGATSITIGRRGLYGYLLASADTKLYDYVATAITAGDVDQKEIAALWTMYEADGLKLAGQTVTAAAGVTFPASIASPTNITAGTINSVLGTVSANLVQIDGDTDPVDNLVLALGNSSGVMISDAAIDAVWDEPISGHLTAGTTGAKLNTASSASGSGSTSYTDTVTDKGSNPLDGVEVWITSDSGGASTVASTTTNTLGAFTVYLDPGTYYLWCAKGGINFPNPTTITVT